VARTGERFSCSGIDKEKDERNFILGVFCRCLFPPTRAMPRSGKALAVAFVVATCALTHSALRQANRMSNGGLFVYDEDLNFGEVFAQRAFELVLPVYSRASTELKVERAETSCACTRIEPRQFTVLPGQRSNLKLTLDLTQQSVNKTDQTSPFSVFVRLHVNSDDGRFHANPQWQVTGTVRLPLRVTETAVDFGEYLQQSDVEPRTILVEGYTTLRDLVVKSDPRKIKASVRAIDNESGTFEVMIEPSKSLPPGPFKFDVSIIGITGSQPKLPPLILPVSGRVLDDIYLSPSRIDFGIVRTGETVQETVILASRSGLFVAQPAVSGVDAHLAIHDELQVDEGEGRRLSVVLNATASGPQSRQISLYVPNDSRQTTSRIVLPITYHGVAIE
jgi:hypothetical protein